MLKYFGKYNGTDWLVDFGALAASLAGHHENIFDRDVTESLPAVPHVTVSFGMVSSNQCHLRGLGQAVQPSPQLLFQFAFVFGVGVAA